jgi:hypothetical protein
MTILIVSASLLFALAHGDAKFVAYAIGVINFLAVGFA